MKDPALTTTVCSASCGQTLARSHDHVVAQCNVDALIAEKFPVLWVIDSICVGWNETCMKNADGAYCNDVIDSWDVASPDTCGDCWILTLSPAIKALWAWL
ncbi:uncharacterized protein BO66DRAFT_474861 [Aspergillus aculeatinus CBS 121060]|uniref:Uncharacterized protein n=1 Tax=Aspergillus aculeatinus CBS 121060 TaxID=1448322 RepID=A0ACD1GW72_9EURO|nr:hypothetical protein BO66DRAFT_474861 [Aspergillus aculeatinus CBS 121060]RAH65585.1 hypothetical protein BO66DRAFT_474861 [Aspergillus aculeatinus CBS 121060]